MDAKQLEEDVGASPRSFGSPSNDPRKFSGERGDKISAAYKRRTRPQRIGASALPWVLDEDFEEMSY
ncbi:hypothetical protein [Reyranella sp.]|uniref:hypothetical protein n=1 Tax=Reyranella sp. TaxID=1929291 RepID=UPI001214EBC9|nr:hypothetical protein [Reyranella sp.]TAJ89704.1 MAG: hypothetical protein EPO50_04895 [Reyranella sp.]